MKHQAPEALPLAAGEGRSGRQDASRSGGGPRRWPVLLILAATLLVPALFWRQVWWGAPLDDQELEQRLSKSQNIRELQHAVEDLSRRIQEKPESARAFYPKVTALADHPEALVRSAAAWVMGEASDHEPFRDRLRYLLTDTEPVVRYNAALALTRFADASGRHVLREMLRPHVVQATWAGDAGGGTVADVLRPGDPVRAQTQVALVNVAGGNRTAILAPLAGRLVKVKTSAGQYISRGAEIGAIAPNADQVWAALRGLYLVGGNEDLEDVDRFTEPPPHFPARVAQQAKASAEAIRQRGGSG